MSAAIFIIGFIFLFIVGCEAICGRGNRGNNAAADPEQERDNAANTAALGQLSRIFDWGKFREHEECVICLEPFKDDDMVTPLPCDKRHYFHSKCIEEWSQNHNTRPLCKAEFNKQMLEEAVQRRSTVSAAE